MMPVSISEKDLLNDYGHPSLQQLARPMGIDIKGKGKAALVNLVSKKLYDARRIAEMLKELHPNEREVLDRVILSGGEMTTQALRAQLEAEGKVAKRERRSGWYRDVHGSASKPGSNQFEDIVARLGALGLLFATSETPGNKADLLRPGRTLFIPKGILRHLPAVTFPFETVPPPAREQDAPLDALHRDVYVLLSMARDEPITLTVRNQIPKRKLTQIDEALRLPEGAADVRSEADLGRLPLLRSALEELGLLIPSAGSLRLSDGATAFLARPRGERQRLLFDAYRQTTRWSEFSRLRDLSLTPRTGIYHQSVAAARQRILTELAGLPGGDWISLDHVIDQLRRRAYDFLLPRSWAYNRYYYYYGSDYNVEEAVYYGSNPLGVKFESHNHAQVDWNMVEGGFIRDVITEALFWLGVVDLGESGDTEEVNAFRITEAGKILLSGGTPSSPVPTPDVIIQPNFQIFAFEPTGEDVLYTLDRMARRVRSEQVVEYQLTRETIYAAQQSGMEIAQILTFLEGISRTHTIPQNVRRSLEEWGAQHERIVVRRGVSAVQAADADTLDALYADPEISRLLGRRVAPTMALVPAEHLDTIFTRLVAEAKPLNGNPGRPIPALTEGNDVGATPAVLADADGHITFRQPVPSIFVQHALSQFTEEDRDGSLRLTPGSLRRGAKTTRAEDMIATLERVHPGPLPEEVQATIRRWAKDWGRGALAQATLLQVESAEIMGNLLGDPEMKRYLHPIAGSDTLATVPKEHVRRVRSLLEERGMELGESLK